jgi:hypothetical protein
MTSRPRRQVQLGGRSCQAGTDIPFQLEAKKRPDPESCFRSILTRRLRALIQITIGLGIDLFKYSIYGQTNSPGKYYLNTYVDD